MTDLDASIGGGADAIAARSEHHADSDAKKVILRGTDGSGAYFNAAVVSTASGPALVTLGGGSGSAAASSTIFQGTVPWLVNTVSGVSVFQGTSPWLINTVSGVSVFQGTSPWLINTVSGISVFQGTKPWIVGNASGATVFQGSSPWVVSGTITVNQGSNIWTVGSASGITVFQGTKPWNVQGDIANDTAVDSGNPVKIGGWVGNLVSTVTIGGRTNACFDNYGKLGVFIGNPYDSAVALVDSGTGGLLVNFSPHSAVYGPEGSYIGASLTATYITLTDFSGIGAPHMIRIANSCNQTIILNMDGTNNTNFTLEPRDGSLMLDLGSNQIQHPSNQHVRVKHAGVVPTSGTIRITGIV